MAFDVFAVGGKKRIGSFLAEPGESQGFVLTCPAEVIEDTPTQHVSLVLRPSEKQAARTADLVEIWGEDVQIDNVSVQLPLP